MWEWPGNEAVVLMNIIVQYNFPDGIRDWPLLKFFALASHAMHCIIL